MTIKEIIESLLKDQNLFEVVDVMDVNHKPHPYCITPAHIDGKTMVLDEHAIRRAEKKGARCGMYVKGDEWRNSYKKGWKKCDVPYDEHTSDKVCFLKLLRGGTEREAKEILTGLAGELEEGVIDGFAFVETEEKFRIG